MSPLRSMMMFFFTVELGFPQKHLLGSLEKLILRRKTLMLKLS
ncbi:hypothetical protein bcere0029_55450 [Bacillus cereus AH1272]|nr:hypothetical protein bcere0029_55450 [Bacillus cereus AH1272]